MRGRLDRVNGGHGNQLIWTFPATEPVLGVTPPQNLVVKSFLLMDRWLSNIEADHSGKTQAQKVLADKPSDAVDACFVDPGAPEFGLPPTGNPRRSRMCPSARRSTRPTATRGRPPAGRKPTTSSSAS
jgi:hypothetical protein